MSEEAPESGIAVRLGSRLLAAVMAVVVYLLPSGWGFVGLGLRIAVGAVIYAAGVVTLLPIGRQLATAALGKAVAFRRDRLVRAR